MSLCAAAVQIDNNSSTTVTLVEMKLHQRLHLSGESFLGTINKDIDVVRMATRYEPLWDMITVTNNTDMTSCSVTVPHAVLRTQPPA
jgi:hypothetical protein